MTNRNEQTEETVISTTLDVGVRELAHRSNDGIDVRLFWRPRTNQVFVTVDDELDGESFELEVDPANALDAFRHPFAYADRVLDDLVALSN